MKHMDKTFARQNETVGSNYIEITLAIIMPPLAVLMNRGLTNQFFICSVLTLLGFIPGMIYAFFILFSDMKDDKLAEDMEPKS